MSTLVSIIVPAFNASAHIAASVASALAQSHDNLEVIVVDDGSTDRTAEVVNGIGDRRVRLLRQENKGQSAALNRGAADATGSYIKFLDADDLLNPSHIESQIAALGGSADKLASCRWGYFRNSPDVSHIREEKTNRDYDNPADW
ncbi:MAG: glycosyltransferase family A protein, partial [Gemmatimonadales bacterium]